MALILRGTLSISTALSGSLTSNAVALGSRLEPTSTITIIDETWPEYSGTYEVTPSASEQTLSTEGFRMLHDVVVAPIPNNWGLITWNGSVITVS